MNLFELAAKLTLDSSDYEKGIEAAKQAAANFSKGLSVVVTAVSNADRAVNNAADSAENLGAGTSNAADGVNMLNQAEAQTTQAANAMARAEENAADSAENLSQSAENASESISETEQSASSSVSKFKNFQSAIQTIISKFGEFARSNSTVQRAVETVKTKFETFRGVLDKAKSKIQEVTDKGKNLADRGLSKIQSGIEKVKSKFEPAINAFSKAKGWLEKLKDKFKKVGDEEDKTSEKTLKFKDIVKSILTADAIKAGLGMLWNGVKRIGQAFISVGKQAVEAYGNYEQLAGGAKKIFENMDFSQIEKDAKEAYKDLNMSASQYLEAINLAGSSFAQTMGDKKGYETARKGMKAIADYASGTGKNINELNQKYQMISRSASVYQSIADQFSGILPQTSADFLKQAQSAGFLEKKYKKLTEVPVAKYQQAVTKMIEKGVDSLGLLGNTAKESTETLTGSLAMTKAAWENLLVAIADEDADFDTAIDNLIESATAAGKNLIPRIEQVIKGIGRAIEKLLPIALEEAPKAIARYAPEVLNALQNLLSVIYTSLNDTLVNTDWSALGGKIADGVNNIDLPSLVGNLATTISNALSAVLDLAVGFVETIDWYKLGENIINSTIAMVENIDWASVISKAFELLGAALGGIKSLADGLAQATWDAIKAGFEATKEYFNQYIEDAGGNVIEGLFNGIIHAVSSIGSWIYSNIFKPFIDGFKNAFGIHSPSTVMAQMGKFIIDGLVNGIKDMPAKVWNFFVQTVQKAIQFGSDMKAKAVKAAADFVVSIVNGFKNLPSKMASIGGNVVKGLWNGIKNVKDWILDKIKGFGKGILDGLKKALGIASPSKFTAEDGKFLVKGLAKGILDNADEAEKAASKLSDGVLKAFNSDSLAMSMEGLPDLNADISSQLTVDANREENQTIALLTTILNAIYAIDDSIGGKIQKAIDNTDIRWNDRELGRLVKTYA